MNASLPASVLCFHCEQPIPDGAQWSATIDGQLRQMCCPACAAIAEAIEYAGMGGYYRARTQPADRFADLSAWLPPFAPGSAVPADTAAIGLSGETAGATRSPAAGGDGLDLALYDDPGVQSQFVVSLAGSLHREAHLLLHHVRCGACAWLIEGQLRRQRGVCDVQINTVGARLIVRWDPAQTALAPLIRAIRTVGYDASPWEPGQAHERHSRQQRRQRAQLVVAGLGIMQVMMYAVPNYLATPGEITPAQEQLMQWASLALTLPVLLFSAQGLFSNAWTGLRAHHLNMDLPVSLGLLAAFGGSVWSLLRGSGPVWFDSVTMFVCLLLLARWLEQSVRDRALSASAQMSRPLPAQAWVLGPPPLHTPVLRAVSALQPGELIRVQAGEAIPVDGRIVAGAGEVEEALLTGESTPVWRSTGDTVLAASSNLSSVLDIEVHAIGAQSVFARVIRQMDLALGQRAPIARLADRAAAHFVMGLLLVTALTALWWCWFAPARALGVVISVLVVSCPCALALAVPATLAASTARLARRGVLILQGHALETLASARTFVFDKTGTLTRGRPTVCADWLNTDPTGQRHAASLMLGLELGQNHPLARALCAFVQAEFPELTALAPQRMQTHTGDGVEGEVDGRIWRLGQRAYVEDLLRDGVPQHDAGRNDGPAESEIWLGTADGIVAIFRCSDSLRPDAAVLIAKLQSLGMTVCMLSGDRTEVVADLARTLGIAHARGGMRPADKLAEIRRLQARGPLVMVGDGLNDAPGLGGADLAIVVGRPAQALARGADMMLPAADLSSLGRALDEARSARRHIQQNLAWALAYNLLMIPLAAAGVITPWLAGLGMSISSLLVMVNGMRPWKF